MQAATAESRNTIENQEIVDNEKNEPPKRHDALITKDQAEQNPWTREYTIDGCVLALFSQFGFSVLILIIGGILFYNMNERLEKLEFLLKDKISSYDREIALRAAKERLNDIARRDAENRR